VQHLKQHDLKVCGCAIAEDYLNFSAQQCYNSAAAATTSACSLGMDDEKPTYMCIGAFVAVWALLVLQQQKSSSSGIKVQPNTSDMDTCNQPGSSLMQLHSLVSQVIVYTCLTHILM
jgi:hypothetical protein